MVVYFFCAESKGLHFDGSLQRDERVKSNDEYNEIKNNIIAQISVKAGVKANEINITAFNLL